MPFYRSTKLLAVQTQLIRTAIPTGCFIGLTPSAMCQIQSGPELSSIACACVAFVALRYGLAKKDAVMVGSANKGVGVCRGWLAACQPVQHWTGWQKSRGSPSLRCPPAGSSSATSWMQVCVPPPLPDANRELTSHSFGIYFALIPNARPRKMLPLFSPSSCCALLGFTATAFVMCGD